MIISLISPIFSIYFEPLILFSTELFWPQMNFSVLLYCSRTTFASSHEEMTMALQRWHLWESNSIPLMLPMVWHLLPWSGSHWVCSVIYGSDSFSHGGMNSTLLLTLTCWQSRLFYWCPQKWESLQIAPPHSNYWILNSVYLSLQLCQICSSNNQFIQNLCPFFLLTLILTPCQKSSQELHFFIFLSFYPSWWQYCHHLIW